MVGRQIRQRPIRIMRNNQSRSRHGGTLTSPNHLSKRIPTFSAGNNIRFLKPLDGPRNAVSMKRVIDESFQNDHHGNHGKDEERPHEAAAFDEEILNGKFHEKDGRLPSDCRERKSEYSGAYPRCRKVPGCPKWASKEAAA
jgi:hypothetical protein